MRYSQQVLARVRAPRFVGALPKDDANVGTGEAGSLDGGTLSRISIRVDPQSRRIGEARFKVFGCSAAIASASLVTEQLQNSSIDQARGLSPGAVAASLALPAERLYAAALAVEAAQRAVDDWEGKASRSEGRPLPNDGPRT
ncbi:MAG: iron-sulfur cluster assembly scaffold protein [Vicinamibacterales bacterium]